MGKRATSSRRKTRAVYSITDDTPTVEIPSPNLHRQDRLPIHAVGSVKFEELCRDVLKHAHSQITRRTLKRTSGQRQFGVDVEGFNADHESEIAVSCKCYRDVEPSHLFPWTQDFVKHLGGHWKDKGVKVFVLAVTHPGIANDPYRNSAQIARYRFSVSKFLRTAAALTAQFARPADIDVAALVEAKLPVDFLRQSDANAPRGTYCAPLIHAQPEGSGGAKVDAVAAQIDRHRGREPSWTFGQFGQPRRPTTALHNGDPLQRLQCPQQHPGSDAPPLGRDVAHIG